MDGVQLCEAGCRAWDCLQDVPGRREGVHRTEDGFVEGREVGDEADFGFVRFGNKEARAAPRSWCCNTADDAAGEEFGDSFVSEVLEAEWNGACGGQT